MSRILLHSLAGDALGLALRLQREGHDVQVAIIREDSGRVGDGLVEKVDDPIAAAQDADLVIFDQVGAGSTADLLRQSEIPVFGAGRAMDLLELDRIKAMDVFRGLGLDVPPYEVFQPDEVERALAYIEKRGTKLVFKPSGNAACDKTFLAEDAEEMIEYVEHTVDQMRGEESGMPPFLLQDFVDGAEVSTERWYASGRPVRTLDNHTIEAKKMLASDLGPAVGCAGNVVMSAHPALVAATVAKLDRYAAIHKITGCLDLNAIVEKRTRKPLVLEATCRFGYHALEAFMARWDMPVGDTLEVLTHDYLVPIRYNSRVGAAIPVAIPPWPNEGAAKARGMPIVDDVEDDADVWLGDVYRDEEDRLVCAGSDGVVYIATGTGNTIQDAYRGIYDRLAESRLPDRMWRADLIEHALARLHLLAKLGYPLL